MSSDRIEKTILLRAPQSRVWQAITNARQFGAWFGVTLDGDFAPGARVEGRVTNPGYEHVVMQIVIERVDPERLFSYRWHPNAVEPGMDYSDEPTTLVEFRLEEVAGGTRLTVIESGFDRVPLERRATAFRMNDQGWTEQIKNIERYVTAQHAEH